MTIFCFRPLAVLVLLGSGGTSEQPEGALLRYRWKAQDELTYELQHRTTTDARLAGFPTRTEVALTADLRCTVGRVDENGTAELTLRVLRLRIRVAGPLGPIEYDTRGDRASAPAVKLLSQPVRAAVDEEVRLTVDTRGRVKDLKPSARLLATVEQMQAVAGPAPGGAAGVLTGEVLRGVLELAGAVLPDEPVKRGHKWERQVEQQTPFGTLTARATLNAHGPQPVRDRKEVEKITSQWKAGLQPNGKAQAGVKLTAAGGSGTVLFDRAAGRLAQATAKQDTATTIGAAGIAGSYQGKTTVSLKLVK